MDQLPNNFTTLLAWLTGGSGALGFVCHFFLDWLWQYWNPSENAKRLLSMLLPVALVLVVYLLGAAAGEYPITWPTLLTALLASGFANLIKQGTYTATRAASGAQPITGGPASPPLGTSPGPPVDGLPDPPGGESQAGQP